MALLLTWMKVSLPRWDSIALISLPCYFTPATVCDCGDQGIVPFVRARCCWACLLGQFGICSYLVMYGRSSALGHPGGRASAIASSPEAVPLALAKCLTRNF